MRVKQIWTHLPLPSKVKLVWDRITFSKLTIFFFVFSLTHFAIQVVLQVQAFTINASAASFLFHIVEAGNATISGFVVMGSDTRVCYYIPSSFSTSSCQALYPFSQDDVNRTTYTEPSTSATLSLPSSTLSQSTSVTAITSSASRTVSVQSSTVTTTFSNATGAVPTGKVAAAVPHTFLTKTTTEFVVAATGAVVNNVVTNNRRRLLFEGGTVSAVVMGNNQTSVTLNGFGWTGQTVELSASCLMTLNGPVEKLDNTKREDITFIAFQFWVLGMSIVSILNESIPHTIAALLTHLVASAWGGYQLFGTAQFRAAFNRLSSQGPCSHNVLMEYWQTRADAEMASLALNAAALVISCFFTWKLIKLFGWQTFKRVGASRTINRVYKIVLSLSIAIQLSLFFIVTSMALWIDQLYNGAIGHLATNQKVFKIVYIGIFVTLIPWLVMGWFAARREQKIPMLTFIGLSLVYMGGWGAMWVSSTFRWTFVSWPFFSAIVSGSLLLMASTFVLGVMCRMNFGKGLPRYLNAEEPIPTDNFVSAMPDEYGDDDPEKVDFPSNHRPIPTYSAAFGRSAEVPPPSQMRFGPQPGHRSKAASSDMGYAPSIVTSPSAVRTRSASDASLHDSQSGSGTRLERQSSQSSQSSDHSTRSGETYRSNGRPVRTASRTSQKSEQSMGTNRWVIE